MKNSGSFFANKECEYYPCHKTEEDINCLFCYCPMYAMDNCPGSYEIIETSSGKRIKSCMDCTFPHKAENYEKVIAVLKANM